MIPLPELANLAVSAIKRAYVLSTAGQCELSGSTHTVEKNDHHSTESDEPGHFDVVCASTLSNPIFDAPPFSVQRPVSFDKTQKPSDLRPTDDVTLLRKALFVSESYEVVSTFRTFATGSECTFSRLAAAHDKRSGPSDLWLSQIGAIFQ